MQVTEVDRRLWQSIPGRLATIIMAIAAGSYAVPAGLIAGAVAFFTLVVIRRQLIWFPARPAWGYMTLVYVPLSQVVFWASLAFLLFGLWRQGINPLLGIPIVVGWKLAIMAVERTKLSLL